MKKNKTTAQINLHELMAIDKDDRQLLVKNRHWPSCQFGRLCEIAGFTPSNSDYSAFQLWLRAHTTAHGEHTLV